MGPLGTHPSAGVSLATLAALFFPQYGKFCEGCLFSTPQPRRLLLPWLGGLTHSARNAHRSSAVREDCISELCRYGAAELHNVAAFIGGAAAHEVVKLTTRQYIPFNNTYVFNGMTGSATTIDL